jgi:conjugative relaxase-like TrwC/TraI family protein
VRYYADSIEGPGRWIGAGAAYRKLDGAVDRDAFQRVLEGRHPATGERLVTAQGSSQRGHLAVGTAARFDEHGEPMYTLGDTARLLGLRVTEIRQLVQSGADDEQHLDDDAGWIGSVSMHGMTLIPDAEITRHLTLAALPTNADQVRSGGDADELLTTTEVARALHVSPQYVRRLCARGERPETSGQGASIPSVRSNDNGYLVRRADVADFAERRKVPVARVGFDVTLTVEKSIGIVTMLSTGLRQDRLVEALTAANDTAISYLDRHASVARRKGAVVNSEGLLVASYLHGTSRALDPHPHVHNVVANAIVDDEGGVRTLDARALYRHAPAAAALASAAIRWETQDLGLGWWQRPDGVWEVAGVDEASIRAFSQRRAEMDEVRKALEERLGRRISHEEENTIALSTRADKQAVDPIALRKEWLSRADRVGLDVGSCFDRADRARPFEHLPEGLTNQLFADLVDPDTGVCATTNTFDRGDVMKAITDWSINEDDARVKILVPPEEVERLTSRFCASSLVVEIDQASVIRRRDGSVIADGQAEPTFATIELLECQQRIVSTVETGIGGGCGSVDPEIVEDTIVSADRLSVEQADLVRAWLTSGDRVQCAVGRAGTGKTTTMQAAAGGWTAGGYRVLGAAVKGEAARQLAGDAGIESETVAMLLARSDAGIRVLDSRTVLIVDEASTLGDRDLLRLCDLAIETGATLRLIGDTAQHGSVPAGGTFAELVDHFAARTPELSTVRRLTDPAELRRADLVRSGKIGEALDDLEASGQLVLTASDHDTHAAMLARWYTERTAGSHHPMVHGRNRQRRALNGVAQQILISDGVVDPKRSVTLADGRRLCVGDQVLARHGDRTVHPEENRDGWLRNGTRGEIVHVRHDPRSPGNDEIDMLTTGGVITCARSTFDRPDGGIDLAYAVTSYAVQGATNNVSTSAIGPTTSRSELYVDITRGRNSNQLYGTRPVADNGDTEQHLPRLTAELMPVLRTRLAKSGARTALGIDPHAPRTASLMKARTLAGLVAAQRRDTSSPGIAIAIARAEAAVRRIAEHEPPANLTKVLPARPGCPHLAANWCNTAGDVAVYLATENPRIRPDQGGLRGVIGSRADAIDPTRWDATARSLRETATDIVYRQLLDHLNNPTSADQSTTIRHRPEWLTEHLHSRAEAGTLPSDDIDRLAAVVHDVHRWRVEHDLIDATTPDNPLGPIPDEPSQRAEYAQLQRRLTITPTGGHGRAIA